LRSRGRRASGSASRARSASTSSAPPMRTCRSCSRACNPRAWTRDVGQLLNHAMHMQGKGSVALLQHSVPCPSHEHESAIVEFERVKLALRRYGWWMQCHFRGARGPVNSYGLRQGSGLLAWVRVRATCHMPHLHVGQIHAIVACCVPCIERAVQLFRRSHISSMLGLRRKMRAIFARIVGDCLQKSAS
jgi:hypothetical protein